MSKHKHNQHDLFRDAPPDRPPSARPKRRTLTRLPMPRIDTLAVGKLITEWLKGEDKAIKEDAISVFATDGFEVKRQPENFIGVGELSSGSVQLKRRSSTAALSEEEVEIVKKAGLSVEEIEDIPDRYAINPDYMADQDLLRKVNRALMRVEGLPNDFIVRQQPVRRTVVTDVTLSEAFEKASDIDHLKSLLRIVAVPSIGPKLNKETTLVESFLHLIKALDGGEEEQKAEARPEVSPGEALVLLARALNCETDLANRLHVPTKSKKNRKAKQLAS